MSKSTKPVLIYRLGSLGDTLVALPCFHKIAEVFPDRQKLVLTNFPVSTKAAPLEVILRPSGLIDGAIEYPAGLRSVGELLRLRSIIKRTGSDTLIYLAASRGRWVVLRDFIFFRLCGFSQLVGLPLTGDLLQNRFDPIEGTFEPEAERLARTLASLGPIDLGNPACWDIRLTLDEKRVASEALSGLGKRYFFSINMGGKVADKDWGMQNWRELSDLLTSVFSDLAMVVVGSAEDSTRAVDLLGSWPGGGLNVCGLLSPRESAAVLGKANFFVGHDSGPLHLAAAMQTPCVGIFGDYNRPKKWHPYGQENHSIHDMRGVQAIKAQQVFDAILSISKHHSQNQKSPLKGVQ